MVRPIRIVSLVLLLAMCSLILYELNGGISGWPRMEHRRIHQQSHADSYTGNLTLRNHSKDVWKAAKKTRISCWIMTSPNNLEKKARYIQETWAKRCDRVVFISSETNTSFPTVAVNASEGRQHLTEKTLRGFHYVSLNHIDDCDWFLKADDDTYVIVENLRLFLKDKDTNEPVYYGHVLTIGGAGIVVSKKAMRRFAKKGLDPGTCRQEGKYGDVAFAQCMNGLGVRLGNSTDSMGRSRLHAFRPEVQVLAQFPAWYSVDGAGEARGVSEYPISFHYIDGPSQLLLDYFFHYVKVHHSKDSSHGVVDWT